MIGVDKAYRIVEVSSIVNFGDAIGKYNFIQGIHNRRYIGRITDFELQVLRKLGL